MRWPKNGEAPNPGKDSGFNLQLNYLPVAILFETRKTHPTPRLLDLERLLSHHSSLISDHQASSNVAYRILDINKLFRSKNRFYLDLFRSYAKEGARRRRELRDGLQSHELLCMHDTFQRKVHQCGTILVLLPTKYRKIALNSRCSWIDGSQATRELAQLW
jgi:hypothetical protein